MGGLTRAGQVLATTTLILEIKKGNRIEKSGGNATGLEGRLKVKFSKDVLPEPAEILFESAGPEIPLSKPFVVELKARGLESQADLHRFNGQVELEFSIDAFPPDTEYGALVWYWYDTERNDWFPLPSAYDPTAKVVRGWTDHFSAFAVDTEDWLTAKIPPLSADVALYTGAATYSLPIEVPAGPGGLTPTISLDYNSQAVDSATSRTPASWVGMGWSLTAGGYIRRDMSGSPNRDTDDLFSLVLGPEGHSLIPVNRTSTYIEYQTQDQNFWRIYRYVSRTQGGIDYGWENDYWVIWDKTGMKYTFDVRPYYLELNKDNGNVLTMRPWSWYLREAENQFGQKLSYYYDWEETYMVTRCWEQASGGGCGYGAYVDIALYLSDIVYPDNHTRIKFIHERNRTDFQASWADEYSHILYEKSRLASIQVIYDPSISFTSDYQNHNNQIVADASDVQIIREYKLTHTGVTNPNGPTTVVFPGVEWDFDGSATNGRTLALQSVQEFGVKPSTGVAPSLPPITFTYDDMHLTDVNNGQGGKITIAYDNWYASDAPADNKQYRELGTYWQMGEPVYYLDVFRPGQAYRVSCGTYYSQGDTLRYRIDGGAASPSYSENIVIGSSLEATGTIILNPSASVAHIAAEQVSGTGAVLNGACDLWAVLTRYQAKTKTLTDTVTGTAHIFTYDYIGAAVNDTDTSAFITQALTPLTAEAYSEFRGHSTVTLSGPNNLKTVTTFYQDDLLKGKIAREIVYNASNDQKLSETIYNYDSTATSYYDLSFCAQKDGTCFKDEKVDWVRPSLEQRLIYNAAGVYLGTQMEYAYETADQGEAQYGNLTQTIESYWSDSAWIRHRLTRTVYYPNTSGVYLTGLPGWTTTYECPGGTCSTSLSNAISSTQYRYDNHLFEYNPPDTGILTGNRTSLYSLGGDASQLYYADSKYTYDAWGNRATVTLYPTANSYDNYGAGEARTTTYTYDATYHTRLVKQQTTLPVLLETTWEYAAGTNGGWLGLPTKETDPNGEVTTGVYDAFGRLTSIRRPGDESGTPTVEVIYTDGTSTTLMIMEVNYKVADGVPTIINQQKIFVDSLGRKSKFQTVNAILEDGNPHTVEVDYTYDAYGRITQQSIPYPTDNKPSPVPVITNEYDPLGRLERTTQPDGTATSYAYYIVTDTDLGQPLLEISITDARSFVTKQYQDALGQLRRVIPPENGMTVTYTYDALGRLTNVTQPGGYETVIGYDKAGRKTSMSDPDMGAWSYTYDAVGNLQSQSDAKGQTVWMEYDELNRLIHKHATNTSGTLLASFTYDQGTNGKGHRTGMSDPSGSTSWTYDNRGRLTGETKIITDAGTYFTQWNYNSSDQLASMTYPGGNNGQPGETVNFSYHSQGALDKVWGTDTYVNGTSYEAAGNIASRILGSNIIKTSYDYYDWTDINGLHRLQQIKTGLFGEVDPTSLQNLTYTYDPLGNIKTILDNRGTATQTQDFGTYDNMNRLMGVTTSEVDTSGVFPTNSEINETYSYGSTGNLETKGTHTLIYGPQSATCPDPALTKPHAVTSADDGETLYSYCYDQNGNMVKRTTSSGTLNLTYDIANQLTGVSGTADETFVYDGDGNRVKAIHGSDVTVYIGNYYEETFLAPRSNLAPNPGFEGSTDWTTVTHSDFPATSFYRAGWGTASPHAGSNAYTISNHAYGTLQSDLIIGILPGAQYDLFAYVRGEVDSEDSSGDWVIRVNFYNSADQELSLINVAVNQGDPLSSTWRQKGGRFTAPANAVKLRIQLYNYMNSGWVAFDDVSLIKVGDVTQTNLAPNPGFESSGAWAESRNESYPGTSFYRAGWLITAPHAGSYAYTISNHAYGTLQSDLITGIIPGAQYDLYAYVRGEVDPDDSGGDWVIRATFYNASDQNIGLTNVAVDQGDPLSTTWQQKGGRFIAPANAVKLRIQLYNYLNTGWVAFDDVTLIRVGDVTQTNLAPNPGFEGSGSWAESRNASFPGTSFYDSGSLSSAGHSSTKAYAISNQAYGYLQSPLIPVTPGMGYDLYAYIRGEVDAEGSIGCWLIRASFYNSSGSAIQDVNVDSNCTGAITATWTREGGHVAAPGGATQMRIKLYNYLNSGWVAFDDVELIQVRTTLYYYAGAQRIAMRQNGTLSYLLSDPLGSTSVVTSATGSVTARRLYTPWGETRGDSASLPTTFGYTGQREEAELGLSFYNARWYDPALGRFIQADTFIPNPNNPLDWDRYSYVRNNPVNYSDPSGNMPDYLGCRTEGCDTYNTKQSQQAVIDSLLANPREWEELPEGYQTILNGAGLPQDLYNISDMAGHPGVRNAYWYEDPAFYLSVLFGGEWGYFGPPILAPIAQFIFGTEARDCMDGDCAVTRGVVVLGKNPRYLSVASDIQGRVYNVDPKIINSLPVEEQWALNKAFLDEAIARGDYFILASKWSQATNWYLRELEYMFSKGYTLAPNQMWLIPPNY